MYIKCHNNPAHSIINTGWQDICAAALQIWKTETVIYLDVDPSAPHVLIVCWFHPSDCLLLAAGHSLCWPVYLEQSAGHCGFSSYSVYVPPPTENLSVLSLLPDVILDQQTFLIDSGLTDKDASDITSMLFDILQVRQKKLHPVFKNWVSKCRSGYLPRQSANDATATQSSLASLTVIIQPITTKFGVHILRMSSINNHFLFFQHPFLLLDSNQPTKKSCKKFCQKLPFLPPAK